MVSGEEEGEISEKREEMRAPKNGWHYLDIFLKDLSEGYIKAR